VDVLSSHPGVPIQEGTQLLTDALRALLTVSRKDEEGQGLAEYALILGLIAIVAIVSLIFLGGTIGDMLSVIGSTIDSAT
jgi:pilus assembly protein Flp/PilA